MSDGKDRKRTAAGVALMIAAAALVIIPCIRRTDVSGQVFAAGGRETVPAEAVMPDGMIDVNNADAEELTELPGVGETLAMMIIEERNANGRFIYPEDLTAVKGIGLKKLEGFRDMITLESEE